MKKLLALVVLPFVALVSAAGCATVAPADEVIPAGEALSTTGLFVECQLGENYGFSAGSCPGGWSLSSGKFYAPTATPGLTTMVNVCVANAPSFPANVQGKVFESKDAGCQGLGVFHHQLATSLNSPVCGARLWRQYYRAETGALRISPQPLSGYVEVSQGDVGYFFDAPVSNQNCCLADSACTTGTICRAAGQACQAGCRHDSQCGGGQQCLNTQCVNGCRDDSQCAVGQICDGTCRTGCRTDLECAEGQRCDGGSKTCVSL